MTELATPVFQSKKGNVYLWKSAVIFKQTFSQNINIRSVNDPRPLAPNLAEYIVEFVVIWQAEVNKKGQVENAKIIDFQQVDTRTRLIEPHYHPFLDIDRSSFASLGTITSAGQETKPVEEGKCK